MREGAAEGLSWAGAPRADLVFDPGEALQVGPFTVETMALPGHTSCGAGYRVRELDLLVVGDYLSIIEFPFVYSRRPPTVPRSQHCRTRSRATRRARGAGSRACAERREALRSRREDLEYLHALKAAVRSALAGGADARGGDRGGRRGGRTARCGG